jgi:hypothetical protein
MGRARQYLITYRVKLRGKAKGVVIVDALRGLCDFCLDVKGDEDQLNVLVS